MNFSGIDLVKNHKSHDKEARLEFVGEDKKGWYVQPCSPTKSNYPYYNEDREVLHKAKIVMQYHLDQHPVHKKYTTLKDMKKDVINAYQEFGKNTPDLNIIRTNTYFVRRRPAFSFYRKSKKWKISFNAYKGFYQEHELYKASSIYEMEFDTLKEASFFLYIWFKQNKIKF